MYGLICTLKSSVAPQLIKGTCFASLSLTVIRCMYGSSCCLNVGIPSAASLIHVEDTKHSLRIRLRIPTIDKTSTVDVSLS